MDKLIYIVDDDLHIRQLILSFLRKDGFNAIGFSTGEELLAAMETHMPDLVVLDIMLPGMGGLQVCTAIRQKSTIPIMLVSAKDSELDRITGITLGADDYVVKPFSPVELVVRVKALLRRMDMNRSDGSEPQALNYGDLVINQRRREATVKGQLLPLTPTEFDFLHYMLANDDRAISKSELLKDLWHFESAVDTRATDDLVKRLRKKLISQGSNVRIETVWGFGYRLGLEETP